jgi:hypothetical protein
MPSTRVIWDRSGNPSQFVSDTLGIERWQLREALHTIKRRGGLGGAERIIIHADGKVADAGGMKSATSSTRLAATDSVRAFATLRIAGDRLVPDEVTSLLKIVPTTAYAKGQHYSGGPRSPDLVGQTGVWYFSTKGVVAGNHLADHLGFVARLLLPGSGEAGPLPRLQQLMRRRLLRASVSCFWHGASGARKPTVPRAVNELLALPPADLVTDFETDEQPSRDAA